jgi:tripartite-type tricarboxylate transporter receptor subunit TctC
MNTSFRKVAAPRRHVAPFVSDRRLVAEHPRRRFLHLAVGAAMAPAVARTARAQAYPTRPVRIVVPFAPGGSSDFFARLIAQKLSERLGKQFFVENIAGAGGNIGTGRGARAAADGYTLLVVASHFAVNPILFDAVPYDPIKDFDPVALPLATSVMITVHPSLPVQSVKDLVALIRANPGKYTDALTGIGTRNHLAAELFRQSLKLDLVHVPFNGGGLAVISVLAGHTPVFFSSPSQVLQHVKEGKLRALAIMTNVRSQMLPDVPTMAEAGYPGIEGEEWYGVIAPAGTPKDIVALLNREIVRLMALPDIRENLLTLGFELVPATTPEAFTARIKSDAEQWGNVIRAANLKSR